MASVHFGRLLGPAGFARPVAIKRLHPQFARDPDFVKMFLDEARLAARIAHPNVVPTLDVVNVESEVFIVMEYVRGATLAHLARTMRHRGARIPPLIALGIVSGILQGLHAAHEARSDHDEPLDLVHRDVSPQNALVGTDGVTRLLDFGVAKAAGRLYTTRDGQLKGKLAYMAPEQVQGKSVTRRTDIYAASVVLWEALTGERLFYARNEASILANVLCADVVAPSAIAPELSHALDRVVLRGLQRDPSQRYATAKEMAAEVDASVGIASATEIADWVVQTAGAELKAHALRIGSIERAGPSPEGASGPAQATSLVSSSMRPTSGGISESPEETQRERPSKRLVLLEVASALAVAVLVSGVVLSLALSRRAPTTAIRSADKSPASSAPWAPQVAAAEPEPTVPTLNVEDPPAVPAVALEKAIPSTGLPQPAAGAPPGSAPRRAPLAAHPDCNPPYTVDANGHVLFKPNCI